MSQQLEEIHIIEGPRSRDYKLETSISGYPYYSHPEPAHPDPSLTYTDDFIFFPNLTNKFHVYPKGKIYDGFRFVFAMPGVVTIDMSQIVDNPPPPVKRQSLWFVVQRVVYTVKGRDTIRVRRVGAALVPIRTIDITGGIEQVDELSNEVIASVIDQHCIHYSKHVI